MASASGFGTFTQAEYAQRLAGVKSRMEKASFDLIICQDPANMCWLTGYDGWSFYVPQCVLVHLREDRPIWFGRAQDARSARLTTGLPEKNIVPFSERLVQQSVEPPYDELAQLIRSRGWGNARIGVEMDAHYYTARCHAHLVSGLPDAHFANNHDLVNWARLVKSEAELALIREAGAICTHAMKRGIEKMRPGVPQNHVIAEIYQAQIMGVPGAGGDYAAICPLMPVGEGTSTPHLTWSDAPLPDSGLAILEIAGVRRRYHAALTRTVHFGKPPQVLVDMAKAIVEGVDTGLEKARPGYTAEEVEAAWQAVLRKNGLKIAAANASATWRANSSSSTEHGDWKPVTDERSCRQRNR
ncbi:Xaa-Pro peptidase family protein [Mesorhizobium sp.]|uniref:M24 family metallopeptidase n=1 Tax=Mesorhizobium sp. TaxID=1871066 RepID=UPI000FE29EF2|nr:Xaa-Pro peptidase family protein [Mesorhizobium sp.]RWO01320.1 MAG: M24 family metallopeptidase [Mesorhizobium sp.]